MDEVQGNCRLCGQKRPLRKSHIWPAFAYKSFVADQSKGGHFLDLNSEILKPTNRQYKARWFCDDCEQAIGIGESSASLLCKQILEEGVGKDYPYDEGLLHFATSMSLRMAYWLYEGKPISEAYSPALKVWRACLRNKRKDVGPYSQHCFVLIGNEGSGVLSGQIIQKEGFVVSRVGPLIIFGLLTGRKDMSLSRIKVQDQSKIHAKGGSISRITTFLVGNRGRQNNIIMEWMRCLVNQRSETANRISAFKDQNDEYWKQLEGRNKRNA